MNFGRGLGYPTFGGQPIDEPRLGRAEGDDAAVGVGLVEQAMRAEVAEHTSLDNVLEFVPVLGL
jgi:hypothetical protein